MPYYLGVWHAVWSMPGAQRSHRECCHTYRADLADRAGLTGLSGHPAHFHSLGDPDDDSRSSRSSACPQGSRVHVATVVPQGNRVRASCLLYVSKRLVTMQGLQGLSVATLGWNAWLPPLPQRHAALRTCSRGYLPGCARPGPQLNC